MTYTDEISRSVKTTALGTEYIEVVANPGGVSDRAIICIPSTHTDGAGATFVLAPHGSGGSEETINSVNMTPITHMAIDRGFIVGSINAFGRHWMNEAGLARHEFFDGWIETSGIATITTRLPIGQSMGGGTIAALYARGNLPDTAAIVTIDGALSLAACYAHPSHQAHIKTAYGINSSGTDYAAKTAGHDPLLRPSTEYAGLNLLAFASYDDTSVYQEQNTDAFLAHVTPEAEIARLVQCTGGHVTSTHYQASTISAFWDEVLGITPPPDPVHEHYEILARYFVGEDHRLYELTLEV